jgi:hypothetical protein
MKKIFLLSMFSFLFLCSNQSLASHNLGSEITYTCLGGNQYEVILSVYHDCNGVPMSNSVNVNLSSSCSNSNATLTKSTASPFDITPVCATTTSACSGGSGYGIHKSIYTGIVILSPCSDWQISYSSCCRNTLLANLQNPSTQSHYVSALLDNSTAACNNSPVFESDPTLFSCIGDTTYHSFNANEIDGDSLVYSLAPCNNAANTSSTYNAGFTATTPFTGTTSIDAQTGLLTVFATVAQASVICVKVEEYRNGVKIGEVIRDIQVTMLACGNGLPKVRLINNGNIATNSAHIISIGNPITLNFFIYDAEVQAGTQILSAALGSNYPTATTSFNAATSMFSFIWTPTAADVGTNYINIEFNDNNCPYIGENQYTVVIDVLSGPYVTANDDSFAGIENTPITGDVLTNDLSNGVITVTNTPISPTSGTFTLLPSGTFTYTPNFGFVGIDSFIYEVCDGTPICDIATVLLNVQPTPLPVINIIDTIVLGLDYNMYYCLTDSSYFTADTLNNAVMTFVNNSCFSILGNVLGMDSTTLSSANEIVNFYITVEAGVWPGDSDDDGTSNNIDLLNIGIAYGAVGVPRSQQSILWEGYLADDWGTGFSNGLDYKYADANGDGTIDANDTTAILQNWGLSYDKNGGGNGTPIYLETDSMTIVNDSLIYIPIVLGSIQNPVSSIYGLAFTVSYSSGLVKDSSVMIHFEPSWLGTTGIDMISINKDFYDNELTEVAVTRIDGFNMSGGGQIGRMCFTIQDDIIRGVDSIFTFEVFNVTAIDNNEAIVDIQGVDREIHWETILGIANNTQTIDLSNHINIYPNPASNYLNIEAKDVQIETIEIYDLTGRRVLQDQNLINNRLNNSSRQLGINNLSNGMYIVHIKTNLGVWNEKITVFK